MGLRFVPDNTNFDFVKYRHIGFLLSLVLISMSIYFYFNKGISFGIDFTGGVVIEIETPHEIDFAILRQDIQDLGMEGFTIQSSENDTRALIKLHDRDKNKVNELKSRLEIDFADKVQYRRIEYVGPQVGDELIEKGAYAMLAAMIGIYIYLLIRFSWRFSTGGILALIHDVIITIGVFEITGIEFSLTSVVALLTIVGYSINDSVVIYDRIRERITKCKSISSVRDIINQGINSTLSRTVLTSLTTMLSAIPMILFCHGDVKDFSLIVLIGIFIGTYSSIFISAPLLLITGIKKGNKFDIKQIDSNTINGE